MTDDLPWDAGTTPATRNGAKGRQGKCARHSWLRETLVAEGWVLGWYSGDYGLEKRERCQRCGAIKDAVASRRGRTSLRAGKDAERAIAVAYPGGKRTGQFGGPDDVVIGDLFVVQSKAGGWFSERVWAELVKLPRAGGHIPTLIVSDRPGPGHRTRRYVVRMMDDDLDLYGGAK